MKKPVHLIGILLMLVTASCSYPFQQRPCIRGNLYKCAAFRAWILFDSIDSRYTPYHLSLAINVRTQGRLALRKEQKANARGQWPILDESRYIPLAPCDYRPDINPFIEQLDLGVLARLCCQGMKGRLYFVPGRRTTPTFSPILGGISLRICPVPSCGISC